MHTKLNPCLCTRSWARWPSVNLLPLIFTLFAFKKDWICFLLKLSKSSNVDLGEIDLLETQYSFSSIAEKNLNVSGRCTWFKPEVCIPSRKNDNSYLPLFTKRRKNDSVQLNILLNILYYFMWLPFCKHISFVTFYAMLCFVGFLFMMMSLSCLS